jgi:A/G-specific adenine glycosylase
VSAALPDLASPLIAWQRRHGRHALPWQQTRDPYRVWLSEIMLQQTQVATVLNYYDRFVQRFPDVASLAAASLDEVLALWAGLGYYTRARNLHRGARAVVSDHGGQFPGTAQGLATLPGIGRSTAAAIAAFCYGERAAILDGNVKRVLSRALGFDADLATAANERALWQLAEALLPTGPGIESYTQGLMDLGATLCSRRQPACDNCPLLGQCVAQRTGRTAELPVKTKKLKRSHRAHVLLWLQQVDQVWLVQRPDRGVWGGLWSLPEFESLDALDDWLARWPGESEVLPTVHHVLTHFDWDLTPVRRRLDKPLGPKREERLKKVWPQGQWVHRAEVAQFGLPAPVAKLLR